MEEKKPVNVRLSTAVLSIIIAILIAGIGYFVYQNIVLKNKQSDSERELRELQSKTTQELQDLQNKTQELQKTIDEAKNIVNDTSVKSNDVKNNESNTKIKEIATQYISVINSIEALEKNSYKYKLAYINNDDLPELIVDLPDYYTSIIMPLNNKLFIIKNEEGNPKNNKIENSKIKDIGILQNILGYGTAHRHGYSYVPKKSTISSVIATIDEGFTEIYHIKDDKLSLDSTLSVKFEDPTSEEGNYYLEDKQISKQKYKDLLSEVDKSESLEDNTLSATEMINYLKKLSK